MLDRLNQKLRLPMNADLLGFLVNYDINALIAYPSTKLSSIEPYIRQIFQEQRQL